MNNDTEETVLQQRILKWDSTKNSFVTEVDGVDIPVDMTYHDTPNNNSIENYYGA